MQQFQASKPIYEQIADRIKRQIIRHELKAGEKLPSVREMAVQSGVNPNTVQRTYMELEREEVVETKRGQGTFVTENKNILDEMREQMKTEQIKSFVELMQEMGYEPKEMLNSLKDYIAKDGGIE
ncbi:GntR family transcriptional regulator [Bacillus horti]|uniref:GntR family transcriptional regulator n=1 Tax=Caldalkalibacillus horti TaxID=77523 RepID=A0ABT9W4L2_9BACI|nr:GntR family transcriptional regulator [Bacillus horti]MDQ0168187.1 GntR family transcriptional regulator [Bacillus horti]